MQHGYQPLREPVRRRVAIAFFFPAAFMLIGVAMGLRDPASALAPLGGRRVPARSLTWWQSIGTPATARRCVPRVALRAPRRPHRGDAVDVGDEPAAGEARRAGDCPLRPRRPRARLSLAGGTASIVSWVIVALGLLLFFVGLACRRVPGAGPVSAEPYVVRRLGLAQVIPLGRLRGLAGAAARSPASTSRPAIIVDRRGLRRRQHRAEPRPAADRREGHPHAPRRPHRPGSTSKPPPPTRTP